MRRIAITLCCLVLALSATAAAGGKARRYAGRTEVGGAIKLTASKSEIKKLTLTLPHNCSGPSPLKVKMRDVAFDGREFADMRDAGGGLLLIEGKVSKRKATGKVEFIDFSQSDVCEVKASWSAKKKR